MDDKTTDSINTLVMAELESIAASVYEDANRRMAEILTIEPTAHYPFATIIIQKVNPSGVFFFNDTPPKPDPNDPLQIVAKIFILSIAAFAKKVFVMTYPNHVHLGLEIRQDHYRHLFTGDLRI